MYWTYNCKEKVVCSICLQITQTKQCLLFPRNIKNLNQVLNKYEKNLLADDLNIDLLDCKSDSNNHFSVLRDNYDLTNFVKVPSCYKSLKGTLLPVLLTKKPNSFQKTIACETGLVILRSTFIKIPLKTVNSRSYKNFNETAFLHGLD